MRQICRKSPWFINIHEFEKLIPSFYQTFFHLWAQKMANFPLRRKIQKFSEKEPIGLHDILNYQAVLPKMRIQTLHLRKCRRIALNITTTVTLAVFYWDLPVYEAITPHLSKKGGHENFPFRGWTVSTTFFFFIIHISRLILSNIRDFSFFTSSGCFALGRQAIKSNPIFFI